MLRTVPAGLFAVAICILQKHRVRTLCAGDVFVRCESDLEKVWLAPFWPSYHRQTRLVGDRAQYYGVSQLHVKFSWVGANRQEIRVGWFRRYLQIWPPDPSCTRSEFGQTLASGGPPGVTLTLSIARGGTWAQWAPCRPWQVEMFSKIHLNLEVLGVFFLKFPKYWKLISKIRKKLNILENSEKLKISDFGQHFSKKHLTFHQYTPGP